MSSKFAFLSEVYCFFTFIFKKKCFQKKEIKKMEELEKQKDCKWWRKYGMISRDLFDFSGWR